MIKKKIQDSPYSCAAVARECGLDMVYLYQVTGGSRKPSRNTVIRICIALSLPLQEVQELLRDGGFAQLNIRKRRDAVILYGILHGWDGCEINENLVRLGEKALIR